MSPRAAALPVGRLRALRFTLPRYDLHVAKPLQVAKYTSPFYSTPEFRRWRAVVVQRARRRCEWVKDDGSVCGVSDVKMYADHVVEVKDGGAEFDPSNGQCLCARHHTIKTNQVRRAREAWAAAQGGRGVEK